MITAYGGPASFYDRYFIYAVSPLGFTKDGLNYNYYDSRELEKAVTPFIVSSLEKVLSFPVDSETCYCLGNGKNFEFLNELNHRKRFFGRVVPLPHPRWIVQYRRKSYQEFIDHYVEVLR